jgi:protein-disulfide isomerase
MIRGALVGGLLIIALVACAQPAAETDDADREIAARYGDTEITVAEVEAAAGGQLMSLRQQMFQVKDQQLRQMIYNQLLEDAAAAEGLTRAEYVEREVTNTIPEPSDEQIQQVFDQYRSQLPPDEGQARQQIVMFLKNQARAQTEADLQQRLFEAAGVEVLLDPPRVEPKIESWNPKRGGVDAPVVLVEYTDYQCPYCDRAQPTIDAIRERYGDNVLHVFKNLPLPMHQQATLAAEAALCADDQGKFWELHDWLFANKNNISRDTLMVQADSLGLDLESFGACVDQRTYQDEVEADTAEANSFGIRGTPGFTVNGRVLTGAQPLENFVTVIDDELKRKGLPVPGNETAEETPES